MKLENTDKKFVKENTVQDHIKPEHLHVINESQVEFGKQFFDDRPSMFYDVYQEPEKDGYTKLEEIIRHRITKLPIKTILDAGCGAGVPMLRLLKLGYDVKGFDFAPSSVALAKNLLELNGLNKDLITVGDITITSKIPEGRFDCILSIGVFPHLQDQEQAIRNLASRLNPGGSMFIQFRNSLFCLFSLNQYSYEWFKDELIDMDSLGEMHKEADMFLKEKFNTKTYNEELDLLSRLNNPLTIDKLFKDSGLIVLDKYFAHYHVLPPVFEAKYTELFRKLSYSMESPNDWRGHFLASSFIVECVS